MAETFFTRETCRLCDSHDLQLVFTLGATPVGDLYLKEEQLGTQQQLFPLELWLCRACGHPQLRNVVNPDTVYREYIYSTSDSLGLPEHFQAYVDNILR